MKPGNNRSVLSSPASNQPAWLRPLVVNGMAVKPMKSTSVGYSRLFLIYALCGYNYCIDTLFLAMNVNETLFFSQIWPAETDLTLFGNLTDRRAFQR